MNSDWTPSGDIEQGVVSYAENERNVYTSVCVHRIQADTEVVVIPLERYLAARQELLVEAGFGVNVAIEQLGMI